MRRKVQIFIKTYTLPLRLGNSIEKTTILEDMKLQLPKIQ